VWRKSHALVLNIYTAAKKIRGAEHLSLRSQMIRAAMSVPANLVEGVGQRTGPEFGRFIRIAINSANELEYHLVLARDMNALRPNEFASLLSQTIQVRKMLHGLHRSIAARSDKR